jgi:hypothetical protein
MRIFDQTRPVFPSTRRMRHEVTQQHDVAGIALNRKVFIQRTDDGALWFSDD